MRRFEIVGLIFAFEINIESTILFTFARFHAQLILGYIINYEKGGTNFYTALLLHLSLNPYYSNQK